MSDILQIIKTNPNKNNIGCDLFDTLIHRTVHPNYVKKIWAKLFIANLGLELSIDELYAIRKASSRFLMEKQQRSSVTISYEDLIQETFHRLQNLNYLTPEIQFSCFSDQFEAADYQSEISVQFLNEKIVTSLITLQKDGYTLYAISDFQLPKRLVSKMLIHHGIATLFTHTYISCSLQCSKEDGTLYSYVLSDLKLDPQRMIMIGDNKKSDVTNAKENGITAIHLKHHKHKLRNTRNLLRNQTLMFKKAVKITEKRCLESNQFYSEYILFFYFFTERLYAIAKQHRVKNLFFLSREGLFLKRLFDQYQSELQPNPKYQIQTHYLNASRQSITLISLRPLEDENFEAIKAKHDTMSITMFLNLLLIEPSTVSKIIAALNEDGDAIVPNFICSKVMKKLRVNTLFKKVYEEVRLFQKKAFHTYLNSFGVDFVSEGIQLVDVGWGGTMQEGIFDFFQEKIATTGYYLGLRKIYTITNKSKRFGLNFSVYPNTTTSDHIIMANGQIYEQLLAAPHGSTQGYTLDPTKNYVVQHYQKEEKAVYDSYIKSIQEFMFTEFTALHAHMLQVCYTQKMTQKYMVDLALRSGIRTHRKKIQFLEHITKGFYQNIGANATGITYNPTVIARSKRKLIKQFLWTPEKTFKYIVKLKFMLYQKGIYTSTAFLIDVSYWYIKFNLKAKRLLLKNRLL